MRRVWSIVLLLALALPFAVAAAQEDVERAVLAIVLRSEPLGRYLQALEGWTAQAYDPHTRYGVWRVEFRDSSGESMGYAEVSPKLERVLYYDMLFHVTDAQRQMGADAVREFLRGQPDLQALGMDARDLEMWIDYDPWSAQWGAWIEDGYDTVYAAVRFGSGLPWELSDPQLVSISFPNVLSYDDWMGDLRNQAIALAFADPAIAAVLRDVPAWEAVAWPEDDGAAWVVEFRAGEVVLASARVDVSAGTAAPG